VESVAEADHAEVAKTVAARIRGDRFLHSLCVHERNPAYLHCAVHTISSFGAKDIHLGSRTQLLTWYTLNRLRRYWAASGDPAPDDGEEVLKHNDSIAFLASVAKLCYHVSNTEQVIYLSCIHKTLLEYNFFHIIY